MKITKTIKRVYAPLNITKNVIIGGTPTTQVYKSVEGLYDPDRYISPTTITPSISAFDRDGIFGNGNVNAKLASIIWLIDGIDVTTMQDYISGLYIIDKTFTSTRGRLTVLKNVNPLFPLSLSFRAVLTDTRQNVNVKIAIDKIMLSTQDVADDKYTIEPTQPVELNYNPISDGNTIIFDTKVFRGVSVISNTTAGLSFLIYYISGTNRILVTTSNSPEVLSQLNGSFTFDLRMIQKRDYLVALLKGGTEVASYQFSINRKYPAGLTAELVEYGAIQPTQTVIPSKALIHIRQGQLLNPSLYYKIEWHTVSAIGDVLHNQGDTAQIDVNRAGLKESPIDIYFTIDEKPAMSIAANSIGDIFTNALGEPYIFN